MSTKGKLTSLIAVLGRLQPGDNISYPHYGRTGDMGLRLIVKMLRLLGKTDIGIFGNAFFANVEPWLFEAIRDGIITRLWGNPYGPLGAHVMRGDLLKYGVVTTGFPHGGRIRMLKNGEVKVKIGFIPASIADADGNLNGIDGDPNELCGVIGLGMTDADYAEHTCALVGVMSPEPLQYVGIPGEKIDGVVIMDCPLMREYIATGSLAGTKKLGPEEHIIVVSMIEIIKATDIIQNGCFFQTGSGAGLAVNEHILEVMEKRGIVADYVMGGITKANVDMLKAGRVRTLLHGQTFSFEPEVFASLRDDGNHVEISTEHAYLARPGGESCYSRLLDLGILTGAEIDAHFNLNSTCPNGRIVGGVGGAPHVAQGADLCMVFMPLVNVSSKNRTSAKIVDQVFCTTVPGKFVDVVVTPIGVAINPESKSPYIDAIRAGEKNHDYNIVDIHSLVVESGKAADEAGNVIPSVGTVSGKIVHRIQDPDGNIISELSQIETV